MRQGQKRQSERPALARVRRRARLCGAAALVTLLLAAAPSAAMVLPASVLDGSGGISELGGAAIAPGGGSGAVIYLKTVDGTSHVFVSRYLQGRWEAPIRVDWQSRFEARSPRIAAGSRGTLLAVWVTQMATVEGRAQYGLVSATLGPGAEGFGPPQLVDADVGAGRGVSPSLSGTTGGEATVAYRVITSDFTTASPFTPAVQLRPGDVLAEIRVARLGAARWSRLGAVNRNPAASMRPPTEENGPRVATAPGGAAVVAWTEPDQSGASRVYARRLFGSVPGPVLQATPSTWEGKPVAGDADAFALDMTKFGMAQVVARVQGDAGSAFGGPRLVANTLPVTEDEQAHRFEGPRLLGAPSPALGAPSVAIGEEREGIARVGFADAGLPRLLVDGEPAAAGAGVGLAGNGAPVLSSANPNGFGGVLAWPTAVEGSQAVAVWQEFPGGAGQLGYLSGSTGAPVAGLALDGGEQGDSLVAFLQGSAGSFEVAAAPVTAPPAKFFVFAPTGWIRASKARIRWARAASATGQVRYSVVLDGRVVARRLARRWFKPSPRLLGNGFRHFRVLATDGLGQQVLSRRVRLRVDAQPPRAKVTVRGGRVLVRIEDPESGLVPKHTRCAFGGGARERGGSACGHAYARPGRYLVRIEARDRAGNRAAIELPVVVR